ncbi:MAG: hypothetical protein U0517_02495 [Candidatus Andersenbacteria bacterium]
MNTDTSALVQPKTVREAVALTLAYCDAQGLVATAFDVWYNLIRYQASYGAVLSALQELVAESRLITQDGYYSLRGLDAIEARQLRHKVSEYKWRRARRVARLLSLVPFVQAVSVVDSVALNKAKPQSDIDFFIVTTPGHLWAARMCATALTQALRLRRHGTHVRDRACLSFYATSDALALQNLSIAGGDLYLAQWVYLVSPLWQRAGFDLTQQLIQHNPWAAELFPQRATGTVSDRRTVEPGLARLTRPFQWTLETLLAKRLGRWVETKLRTLQLRYMHKTLPTEIKNRSSHIVINDRMLKFHEQDRRTWFRERTLATYQRLLAREPLNLSLDDVRFASGGLLVQPIGATLVQHRPQSTTLPAPA